MSLYRGELLSSHSDETQRLFRSWRVMLDKPTFQGDASTAGRRAKKGFIRLTAVLQKRGVELWYLRDDVLPQSMKRNVLQRAIARGSQASIKVTWVCT